MPTYEIHFRDKRAPEIVHADEMRHERGSIVFRRVQPVILTPCWIVHRRVATSEVAQVRQLHNPAEAMVSPGGYRVAGCKRRRTNISQLSRVIGVPPDSRMSPAASGVGRVPLVAAAETRCGGA